MLAVAAYLAADFISGFVHFLADNFDSADTPVIGPNFIEAFREHHVDPKGITTHDFVDTNGNNSLVSVPFMLLVWLFIPVATTVVGYLFAAFFLMTCVAIFLTNQFHSSGARGGAAAGGRVAAAEWPDPLEGAPRVHHESPYDTYYCITVGAWNLLLDRTRFFERTERLLRRVVPGAGSRLRVEREGSLNE